MKYKADIPEILLHSSDALAVVPKEREFASTSKLDGVVGGVVWPNLRRP